MAERDERGYFLPGNKVAEGARKSSMAKANHLLREATTDEELLAVWRSIMQQAIEGSFKHQQLVLDRLCGKPQQSVDVTSDGGAMQLFAVAMQEAMEKA